ncbi:unnamed protein product [Tilletia controversa]|nr:unnamed protein product [Tilletia controversa]
MADRASYRGAGRGGGGGGGGGAPGRGASSRGGGSSGPGARGGGRGAAHSQPPGRAGAGTGAGAGAGAGGGGGDRPKREAILDLSKYSDKSIRVKLAGGREVAGTLKGFDQLMNLVLDDVHEFIKDPVSGILTENKRALGLVVLRGTAITVINPADGFQSIENPFAPPQQ